MSTPPASSTPHDAFFKETFGQPQVAADFLRHYLPPEVAALFRLETLEPQRDTFVDPDLQEHYSDLLYRVSLIGGENAYVYALFEHKSYPDKFVAFQLLRYMLRIWERTMQQEQVLPSILPIVLYHGVTRWQLVPRFDVLFTGPEELRRYWPSFQFQFTDLSHLSDEQIVGDVLVRISLLMLKYIRDQELKERLPGIVRMVEDLLRQETGLQWMYTILRYTAEAGRQVSEAELRQIVGAVAAQRGSVIMATIAEKWLEQGIEKGREEAAQFARKSILTFLRFRFNLSAEQEAAITQRLNQITDLAILEDLNSYTVQADSLAEYMRRLDERVG